MITFRQATSHDVPTLCQLEQRYANSELANFNPHLQGSAFSHSELTDLVNQHWVVMALDKDTIIGYVICAKWAFFGKQAQYQTLLKKTMHYNSKLNANNTVQYGPIWIHQDYRGQGIFTKLVDALVNVIPSQYQAMIAYIAEDNERSYAAHCKHANMQVIDYLSFAQRDYYLLSKNLK